MKIRDFISFTDAAGLCCVSVETVRRWAAEADIPSGKLHGVMGTTRAGLRRCLRERDMPIPRGLGNWPRILLVEDDADLRVVLHCALSTLYTDVEIKVAEDGLQALGALTDFKPHLIVTDICLPAVDGLTLCHTVREHPELSGTKVLAITGLTDPHIREAAFEEGAVEFIQKPLALEDVKAAALRLLGDISTHPATAEPRRDNPL
ncbi:MAG: response regulator [Elusimicrobiota bacterium]